MSTIRRAWAAACLSAAALWMPAATAADIPGAKPGDAGMTCEQIAAELTSYMQQMMPNITALANTAQDVTARGQQRIAEETPAAIGLAAAATASMADPTGISGKAVGQAEVAHQQEVWQRSMVDDKPLRDKLNAQAGQAVAQGQQLQSDARLQRLMQLVSEKNCDYQ